MNDYIAKPVDEKLLYSKIISLVKKPSAYKDTELVPGEKISVKKTKCTNLEYLNQRTKSDPQMMEEMISLYLEQTNQLISAMKQSMKDQDWKTLQATAHKMIPSFSIVGMSTDYEEMAKKIQENSDPKNLGNGIPELVLQLEDVLTQSCKELEEDLISIKNTSNEKQR
jgi:HPt (histidine-containing phosphotransfer) domain-containing protein